jgi:hypothetical protein
MACEARQYNCAHEHTSEHNTAIMAEYDLTPVLSQYLDRHLIFPLLEFLLVQEVSICQVDIRV